MLIRANPVCSHLLRSRQQHGSGSGVRFNS
jgi:hypothetical protein